MMTEAINAVLQHFGYGIHRIRRRRTAQRPVGIPEYPATDPVWPLPRREGGLSDEEIRREFAKYAFWHYAYSFDGGLDFLPRHSDVSQADAPERHLQRFRHFMPYLLGVYNGSLRGKRVLDIACNSGFWSIQCALLGADVVGFDARPQLIDQANLIKSIVGVPNVAFEKLDFWNMNPQSLGGTFDIVLNLGVLFHLPKPLEALERTRAMARKYILLDTTLCRMADPVVALAWSEPGDIRSTVKAGIIARPSKAAIELMLDHIGVAGRIEIPVRTTCIPLDYLKDRRASWLIEV